MHRRILQKLTKYFFVCYSNTFVFVASVIVDGFDFRHTQPLLLILRPFQPLIDCRGGKIVKLAKTDTHFFHNRTFYEFFRDDHSIFIVNREIV